MACSATPDDHGNDMQGLGFIDCSKKTCSMSMDNINSSPVCIKSNSLLFDPGIMFHCFIVPNVRHWIEPGKHEIESQSWKKNTLTSISIAIFLIMILAIILVFFLILFLCANDHLVPTLSFISKGCHMSPSIAGVTLLALGNAAPDLFTSMAGVENVKNVPLIVSGAIGSGIFVTVFVFGLVLTKTKPAIPQLQQPDIFGMNILMYFCALCMIALLVLPGSVTILIPILGISLYLIYIFFVVWFERSHTNLAPTVTVGRSSIYRSSASLHSLRKIISKSTFIDKTDFLSSTISKPAADNFMPEISESHVIDVNSSQWVHARKNFLEEIIKNPLKIFLYFFSFLLAISIPPILNSSEYETFRPLRRVHRIRFVLFPFSGGVFAITCLRLWSQTLLIVFIAISSILSITIYLTMLNIKIKTLKFHILSVISAVTSFSMATFWSWAVSREVISLFNGVSSVLPDIPPSILGLTILAWGNSFGDLVVGYALASADNFELGITGIFSGPVLNVLLSLSISMFKMLIVSKTYSSSIENIDYPILYSLGLLFTTTITSFSLYQFLPSVGKKYGIYLICIYFVLFIPALLLYPIFSR